MFMRWIASVIGQPCGHLRGLGRKDLPLDLGRAMSIGSGASGGGRHLFGQPKTRGMGFTCLGPTRWGGEHVQPGGIMARGYRCRSGGRVAMQPASSASFWRSIGLLRGRIDSVIQRLIEFVLRPANIPYGLALAAALPPDWPVYQQLFRHHADCQPGRLDRLARGPGPVPGDDRTMIRDRGGGSRRVECGSLAHMLAIAQTLHSLPPSRWQMPPDDLAETGLSFLPRPHPAGRSLGGAVERGAKHRLHQPGAPGSLSRAVCGGWRSGFNFLGDACAMQQTPMATDPDDPGTRANHRADHPD
jgi:hypothetical protein